MELGRLARDRHRHTIASLRRRLKELEDEAKRTAEVATLEKMLKATGETEVAS